MARRELAKPTRRGLRFKRIFVELKDRVDIQSKKVDIISKKIEALYKESDLHYKKILILSALGGGAFYYSIMFFKENIIIGIGVLLLILAFTFGIGIAINFAKISIISNEIRFLKNKINEDENEN